MRHLTAHQLRLPVNHLRVGEGDGDKNFFSVNRALQSGEVANARGLLPVLPVHALVARGF